jgi:hypothetical protein
MPDLATLSKHDSESVTSRRISFFLPVTTMRRSVVESRCPGARWRGFEGEEGAVGFGLGSIIVKRALPMSRHFFSVSRSYMRHFVFVMPAGAPGALVSPVGVEAPDLPLELLSKDDPVLRDPSVELRTLKTPFLAHENRPSAERSAVFIVPTDESVAVDMEAARVLVFL